MSAASPASKAGSTWYPQNYHSSHQFPACSSATAPLVELIQQQSTNYPVEACLKQRQLKSAIHTSNHNDAAEEPMALKSRLSNAQQHAMEQDSEEWPLLD